MRPRTAFLGAAGTLAGAVAFLKRRRRRGAEPEADPAAALREKLAESRTIVAERDEFESAETTVDRAEPQSVEERRRAVHERGKEALEEMRPPESE